jgi:GNAT superfamily N-acetyltransferase
VITIRPMTVADAEAGARCHRACWEEAYRGLIPDAALDRVLSMDAERTERWRTFAGHDPARLIAVDGAEVVGFAAPAPSQDDDLDLLQLCAIYVRRAHWGTGLGQRLMDAAIGDADAFLWMLEHNPRARAFYARNGFRPDGVEQYDAFFDTVEIRLVRRSGGPAA